jgi:hypothetical protein
MRAERLVIGLIDSAVIDDLGKMSKKKKMILVRRRRERCEAWRQHLLWCGIREEGIRSEFGNPVPAHLSECVSGVKLRHCCQSLISSSLHQLHTASAPAHQPYMLFVVTVFIRVCLSVVGFAFFWGGP